MIGVDVYPKTYFLYVLEHYEPVYKIYTYNIYTLTKEFENEELVENFIEVFSFVTKEKCLKTGGSLWLLKK